MTLSTRIRLWLIHAIASWCVRRNRFRDIPHRGKPYLERYAISGWLPVGDGRENSDGNRMLPSLYLHCFRDFDRDPAPHNHPWPWAISLILSGSYFEFRLGLGGRWFDRGSFNLISGDTFHRVTELVPEPGEKGVWTLFLCGRKKTKRDQRSGWGFVEGRYIPWRDREVGGVKTSKRAE